MGKAPGPSDRADLVTQLRDACTRVEDDLTMIEESLNPRMDTNPDDRLLMEMLDVVSDARESVFELRDLLQSMAARDRTGGIS